MKPGQGTEKACLLLLCEAGLRAPDTNIVPCGGVAPAPGRGFCAVLVLGARGVHVCPRPGLETALPGEQVPPAPPPQRQWRPCEKSPHVPQMPFQQRAHSLPEMKPLEALATQILCDKIPGTKTSSYGKAAWSDQWLSPGVGDAFCVLSAARPSEHASALAGWVLWGGEASSPIRCPLSASIPSLGPHDGTSAVSRGHRGPLEVKTPGWTHPL